MESLITREPVVSGKFYASDPDSLKNDLNQLFTLAKKPESYKAIQALIVPHAGYIFSGETAANAYAQLNPDKAFETIFILAPSHHQAFNGASIYNRGNYKTPLGEIAVDFKTTQMLLDKNSHFLFRPTAHMQEHSIEVQLPFLQHYLNKPFKIVPMLIGTQNIRILEVLAQSLAPYFNKKNLFIISSDFSHFPNYKDALFADKHMAEAIEKNSTEALQKAVHDNETRKLKNLATSACGIAGIFILLNITKNRENINLEALKYMNSGDSPYGDKDRVVGYWAIQVHSQPFNSTFTLTDNDKNTLLDLAQKTLNAFLYENKIPPVDENCLSEVLLSKNGVFVSLHHTHTLRGCIGCFQSNDVLYKLIQKMVIAAASNDTRFTPVKSHELEHISIEISVLTPMIHINSKDEIEIGKHGIYIKKGNKHGTLLPQVATNNNWNIDEFLGYCSKNKAGIGWDGWKMADVYTYEAIVFSA
jgi:AmmeMemoRadiSam system protein B/AmmeMemoRadiSam system protein A